MSGTVIRFVHDRKSAHRPALKETPHRAASHDSSGSPAAVLNLHMTSPDTFAGTPAAEYKSTAEISQICIKKRLQSGPVCFSCLLQSHPSFRGVSTVF